jgi:hypothetical protein
LWCAAVLFGGCASESGDELFPANAPDHELAALVDVNGERFGIVDGIDGWDISDRLVNVDDDRTLVLSRDGAAWLSLEMADDDTRLLAVSYGGSIQQWGSVRVERQERYVQRFIVNAHPLVTGQVDVGPVSELR